MLKASRLLYYGHKLFGILSKQYTKDVKQRKSRSKGMKIAVWVLVGLVLAVGLLNASISNAQVMPKQFALAESFKMEWGNGKGQVGLLKVPGRNYGPQSFAVDERIGKIYILDSENQRILIYDLSGNLLSFMLISEGANDLCPGDRGSVYVLYKVVNKVVEYSPSGLIIATYTLIDTKSPVVGIHFNSEQGLFFETADGSSYPLVEKGVKISPEAQTKRKILGLSRNNDYFFLERKSPPQGIIKIFDFEGKVKKELPVKKKEQSIETLTFIGMDDENNIYIAVEETTDSFEVKRYLRKYNPDGVLLAEALIPYSNYVYTFKDLRVSGAGKVYQLLPLKENVKVLMWTLDIVKPALFDFDESLDRLFSYTSPLPEDFLRGDPIDIGTEQKEVEKQNFFLYAASITQNEIMSRAESYRTHTFYVSSSNITSGTYSGGKYVITPVNQPAYYSGVLYPQGVLYQWGGFSNLNSYDNGLAANKFAGDRCTNNGIAGCICTPRSPTDSSCQEISSNAVGVDCSGFVSQTWGLSAKESTSTLPSKSCSLPLNDYLLAGDILNSTQAGHVILFSQREPSGSFTVYEAGGKAGWRVGLSSYTSSDLSDLSGSGYSPYRYRNLSGVFQVDDRVQANDGVNVRKNPGTTCDDACSSNPNCFTCIICKVNTGNTGTIVGSEQSVNGYTWYEIRWDSGSGNCPTGTTGWSAGCYLQKLTDDGPQYEGYHDGATCDYISGWAWDKSQPNTPINVDIYDGSNKLDTVTANLFRQDLVNAGKGDGKHAFSYPTPSSLKDGQSHSIRVRYTGTNTDLFNTPKSITCGSVSPPETQYEGYHDGATCDYISGWAWDKSQPNTPINVDIYDGNSKLATVSASNYREDLKSAGKGDGKHAFSYPTPSSLKDGQQHSISVKIAGTSTTIGAPRTITCGTAMPTLTVNGFASNYSTTTTPYQPTISLTGSGFNSVTQISWSCTMPNGSSCTGSPYVWTSSNWSGKFTVYSDTSASVSPVFLTAGDPTGTYNWSVTFYGAGQSVTKWFTVTKK